MWTNYKSYAYAHMYDVTMQCNIILIMHARCTRIILEYIMLVAVVLYCVLVD